MNSSRSEDLIDITIRISNTRDNNLIVMGKSYYFNMKRETRIKDLLNEFTKKFPNDNDLQKELRCYKLYTKKIIKLNDNNTIEDAFSNKDDSDLNVYDKDETIFLCDYDLAVRHVLSVNWDLVSMMSR